MRNPDLVLPPPSAVPSPEEFDVESILDSRFHNGKLQYLIRWLGYTSDEDSWEPFDQVHAPQKVLVAVDPALFIPGSRLQRSFPVCSCSSDPVMQRSKKKSMPPKRYREIVQEVPGMRGSARRSRASDNEDVVPPC
ncbi:heterochromatin protein 1-like [Bombina bombina]|uniref:heterochromatin protein 1-like n=1 Tax=Bombina bombina TaxID=8345 RepID=UPI00235A7A01|nr:heterochromatin protein 1-like [Bombina bombina]